MARRSTPYPTSKPLDLEFVYIGQSIESDQTAATHLTQSKRYIGVSGGSPDMAGKFALSVTESMEMRLAGNAQQFDHKVIKDQQPHWV